MPPTLDYFSPLPLRSRVQEGLRFLFRIISNKRVRRWTMGIACGLGLLIVMGLVSNRVSEAECELRTARWLAKDPLGGRPFYVLPERAADSLAIFHAAGIWPVQAAAEGPATYPSGEIAHAHSAWPFVVDVDYGWCDQREWGEAGSRRFFCLFGHVFERGKYIRRYY